nr:long-chain-fatty-acyl-CoA reductase [Patulibacter sp.]
MATATTSRGTSTIDIPMLIRGRVIEPDDDAVEFGGRVGARFRTPDAGRYASQLVLADASDLRDLAATPIDEIIDFLAELGRRLDHAKNPLMRTAFELALEAGELTESVLRPVYDTFPSWFDRDLLQHAVESGIGKAHLDGWAPLGGSGRHAGSARIRAVGTRNMHIIAGNVPVVAGVTVIRTALTKGDCLIKVPSNDPFTAMAIVRTMIDLDPDHPVTRHCAVAYWKGGDQAIEREIYRPSRIERLTAWGGMSSMKHIQQYLVPGIELIGMNPKISIAVVGREALDSPEGMREAAVGVALMAGRLNQTACSSARVVYVECSTDEDDLERLERLGQEIHAAFLRLPSFESSAPKVPAPALDDELDAVALDDGFYRVIGDAN